MAQQDQRARTRDSVFLLAELRLQNDGAPFRAKLRNISDAGLMAEGAMRVVAGDRVWVDLPQIGWVAGTAAWAAGDRCGLAFDAPIRSADVQFPVEEVDLPAEQSLDPAGCDQG